MAGAVVGVALAGPGCAKRRGAMGPAPQPNPPPRVETSVTARVSELDRLSAQLEETTQRLPGNSPDEHRRLVRQAFGELAQILPVLYGPNPTGTFRQHLRIVENARTQLASAPRGLAMEPTIDTGLRAAHDSLEALAQREYFDQEKMGPLIDSLSSAVAGLDVARGPAHASVVADAFAQTSQVVRQMAASLGQRLGNQPAARPADAQPAEAQPPDAQPPDAQPAEPSQ